MRKIWVVVGALVVCAAVAFAVARTRDSGGPTQAATATSQTAPASSDSTSASTAPASSAGSASAATSSAASTETSAPASSASTDQPAASTGAASSQTAAAPAVAPSAADEPAIYPDDMFLGKSDAKLTIIEYASLSCPHCAKFNTEVLPRIRAEYIDKGLVRWVFRDFPLNRPAFQAAILAHCDSPLRYFKLLDSLFQSQAYWATQPDPLATLKQIGIAEGIDEKTFDACLADQSLKDKIVSRLQEASNKYKVESTPSFIIKGKLYSGELPYDSFKKLIDDALGQS
jgi:protein-disulfide isomerase